MKNEQTLLYADAIYKFSEKRQYVVGADRCLVDQMTVIDDLTEIWEG